MKLNCICKEFALNIGWLYFDNVEINNSSRLKDVGDGQH